MPDKPHFIYCIRDTARKARRAWFDQDGGEKEFLPAALEIVETPPSPLVRGVGFFIMLFFAAALLWSIVGNVDIIAVAPGRIVANGHTKLVQPLEAGVVRAIHVQDGQQVKAGDVLLEIDSTINEAEEDRLKKEQLQATLDVARLKAASILNGDALAAFIPPDSIDKAQTEVAKTLLINQMQEIRAKLANLDKQIAQNEAGRKAVESTIDKIKSALPMLRERQQLRGYLSEKGYGSKIENLNAQQDLVEHEKELQVQEARLTEANSAVAALQAQRQQAEAEYLRGIASDLAEAQKKASSLSEQLVQASQRTRLQTLKAPVDGTVQQLAVHTEGGVVTPAQVLLAVVPLGSKVEIEAYVSNKDIGFVYAGQDAEIKIDTFNFTRYGLMKGKLTSISQDAMMREGTAPKSAETEAQKKQPEQSSAPQEMVYLARVVPEQNQMDIDGKMVNLSPGMAVTVEIKTGQRRIIDYLLSPLLRAKQQALRER